jgi:dipeptidyl aminopeptidase/acylaminoacyl peptidase
VRAATLLAAAAAAAGILAATVLAAPARVDRVAFTNNKGVYVIGADGSGLRRLTHSTGSEGGIAWSRDGKLLAFTGYFGNKGCGEDESRGDLFLIGADGKRERRLTRANCMFAPPAEPAFAPKGSTLALQDDAGILLARAPGWKPRVVLGHGLFPGWAPDARRLLASDGPNVEVLDTVTRKTYTLAQADFAAWAHTVNSVAYATAAGIFVLHPPKDPVQRVVAVSHAAGLVWSPDDGSIAYYTSSAHPLRTTSWVVPAAGGKPVKLGSGAFPAWGPSGTMLSVDGDDGYLYLVRPDGTGRHRLTKGFGAAWSPVG